MGIRSAYWPGTDCPVWWPLVAGRYELYGAESSIDGVSFRNGLVHTEFQYTGKLVMHTVEPNQDLCLISYVHYETPENWWIIAWANKIKDPFAGFATGDALIIPVDLELVSEMLKNG